MQRVQPIKRECFRFCSSNQDQIIFPWAITKINKRFPLSQPIRSHNFALYVIKWTISSLPANRMVTLIDVHYKVMCLSSHISVHLIHPNVMHLGFILKSLHYELFIAPIYASYHNMQGNIGIYHSIPLESVA